MGAVKVADITVSQSLRRERYAEIVDAGGAFTDPRQPVDIAAAKEAFAAWMLKRLAIDIPHGTSAFDHLWDQRRLDVAPT